MMIIETPTKLRLPNTLPTEALKRVLTFKDMAAFYELQRFKKNRWYAQKNGEEAYQLELDRMKAAVEVCLLKEDEEGYYTLPGLAKFLSERFKVEVENRIKYPEPKLLPYVEVPKYAPRYYQTDGVNALLEAKHAGVEIGCHRKGERVLMFDGSLKAVEDIVVGDKLMGPDSKPRIVEELRRGVDSMYEVETINGQKMYVNGHHILALERTNRSNKEPVSGKRYKSYKGKNPIVFITVNEYLKQSDKFKYLYKMYSRPVEFRSVSVPMDPYLLGLLIGDGSLLGTPNITTADPEIVEFIKVSAQDFGCHITETQKEGNAASTYSFVYKDATRSIPNPLTELLRRIGVWGHKSDTKFIPHIYKANSKNVRLKVLAGLIDTDGSLSGGCFDFISKSKQLAEDVAYISRSLGLRATVRSCVKCDQNGTYGRYHRVTISGDISIIPTKLKRKQAEGRKQIKSPNRFGFKVTKVANQEDYYGFVLDKDHLYLTDTFLVTHNTGLGKSVMIEMLCRKLGLQTIVMAPSKSIAGQLYRQLSKRFGTKYVGMYGDGKKKFDKLITVGIAASLTRIEPGSPAWKALSKADVFIADESHLCPAATLESVCHGLSAKASFRFFFSGTQLRSDGSGLLLDAITGPIVYRLTVREGVDQGFLSKPNFFMHRRQSSSDFNSPEHMDMMQVHFWRNAELHAYAADIAEKSISLLGHQVLILVEHIDQFQYLLPHFKHEVGFAHGGVTKENKGCLDPRFHDSDPDVLVEQFNAGKLPILVGTSCITTGTDIQTAKTIINLQGGQSEIKIRQAIGRGTRRIEGKDFFNYHDFFVKLPEDINDDDDKEYRPSIERHAYTRAAIFNSVYGPTQWIN